MGNFHLHYSQATNRRTSLTIADKYGNSSISPKSGSLPLTTRSSSACAFIWISGKQTIARKNVWIADMVVSDPPAFWVSSGLFNLAKMTCKKVVVSVGEYTITCKYHCCGIFYNFLLVIKITIFVDICQTH